MLQGRLVDDAMRPAEASIINAHARIGFHRRRLETNEVGHVLFHNVKKAQNRLVAQTPSGNIETRIRSIHSCMQPPGGLPASAATIGQPRTLALSRQATE
jgi:hypothetical protein